MVFVGVGHDDGVILGAHHALRAFAVIAGEFVNVLADVARTDERHRLDFRVRTQRINRFLAAVNDIKHARRHTSFEGEFSQ